MRWTFVFALGLSLTDCNDAGTASAGAGAGSAGATVAGATSSAGRDPGAAAGGSGMNGGSGPISAAGASLGGAGAGGLASANGGAGGETTSSAGNAGRGNSAAGSGSIVGGAGRGTGGAPSAGGVGGANAGGAGGGVSTAGAGGAAPHTGAWRITPLGDSITGTTCAPQLLARALKDKGHANFGFFGSNLNNQSCNGAPNVQTEGHGGYLVTDLVGNGQHASELSSWSASDKAEIVLMHFGTNDVWNNVAPSAILGAFSTVLASFRAINPKLVVFVAQIIPMNPSGCSACETRVQALNAQIPAWASSAATAASPIYVVDQHSVFTPANYTPMSTYTADGVHPNVAGAQLIADKWYAALTEHGLP